MGLDSRLYPGRFAVIWGSESIDMTYIGPKKESINLCTYAKLWGQDTTLQHRCTYDLHGARPSINSTYIKP